MSTLMLLVLGYVHSPQLVVLPARNPADSHGARHWTIAVPAGFEPATSALTRRRALQAALWNQAPADRRYCGLRPAGRRPRRAGGIRTHKVSGYEPGRFTIAVPPVVALLLQRSVLTHRARRGDRI